jgi:hypothetical protein
LFDVRTDIISNSDWRALHGWSEDKISLGKGLWARNMQGESGKKEKNLKKEKS